MTPSDEQNEKASEKTQGADKARLQVDLTVADVDSLLADIQSLTKDRCLSLPEKDATLWRQAVDAAWKAQREHAERCQVAGGHFGATKNGPIAHQKTLEAQRAEAEKHTGKPCIFGLNIRFCDEPERLYRGLDPAYAKAEAQALRKARDEATPVRKRLDLLLVTVKVGLLHWSELAAAGGAAKAWSIYRSAMQYDPIEYRRQTSRPVLADIPMQAVRKHLDAVVQDLERIRAKLERQAQTVMPKPTAPPTQPPVPIDPKADAIAALVSEANGLLPELRAAVVTIDWRRRAKDVARLACSCDPHLERQAAISQYEAELKAKGMGADEVSAALLARDWGLPLRDKKEQAISTACQTIFQVLDQLIRPSFIPVEMFPKAHAAISGAVESLSRYTPLDDAVNQNRTEGAGPIFIGHGQSEAWKALRDFIVDDLGLDYEEFDKEPSAGLLIQERLDEMFEKCRFAFLVMTAEDERPDGKVQARPNVVQEIGTCQDRYGRRRAIILLEEGCEVHSNIQGLVHIQFPKGNILAKSDDIRGVLEREGFLPKR